jgi:hypothetical protein
MLDVRDEIRKMEMANKCFHRVVAEYVMTNHECNEDNGEELSITVSTQ